MKKYKIMQTIFKITGGGQRVRQNIETKKITFIEKVENSDWPEKAGVVSCNSYTGAIWATDISTVKRLAKEWAEGYGTVNFQNQ